MKYPYYEVCIGPGPFLPGDDSNFWMCIHGVRQPTQAEAEQFLAEDVKTYGGIVACVHLIPSSPEGYVDLVEIAELSKYSDEELQSRMVGQHRVDINEAWGSPAVADSEPNIDVYKFEDANYQITLEYDSNGCVIGLERNELNK